MGRGATITAMTDQQARKVDAEIAKLLAETSKLNRETFWYPVAVAAGLLGAGGALAKLLGA